MDRRKKFRKKNKAYRNKCRQENYKKTKLEKRTSRPWTKNHEDYLIIATELCTDRMIAKELKRSVQAIQQKRYLLNKGKV